MTRENRVRAVGSSGRRDGDNLGWGGRCGLSRNGIQITLKDRHGAEQSQTRSTLTRPRLVKPKDVRSPAAEEWRAAN